MTEIQPQRSPGSIRVPEVAAFGQLGDRSRSPSPALIRTRYPESQTPETYGSLTEGPFR